MKCTQAKPLFSSYLDSALTGARMHDLAQHLEACAQCDKAYRQLQNAQHLLSTLDRPQGPADLGLKLRVAISREAARRPRFEGVIVRTQNAFNAFILPATAGVATAMAIFTLLLGFFALPTRLQASSADVPLMVYSPPELEASAYGVGRGTISEDSLVVEAYIDQTGRVEDFRILSAPGTAQKLLPQVKQMLIFTVFRPAMAMGQPTAGRAVLTFSKNVAAPKVGRIQS